MKPKITSNEHYIEIVIDYSRSMLLPLEEGLELVKQFTNAIWFERDYSNKGYKIIEKEVEFKIRPPSFLEEVKLNSTVDP